jgi:Kef-type K+ transport system membrane component KefB
VKPGIFLRDFAEAGIIVTMFALGFEENSSKFVHSIKRSWGIAPFGAIVPFLVTYGVVIHFWGDKNTALMAP